MSTNNAPKGMVRRSSITKSGTLTVQQIRHLVTLGLVEQRPGGRDPWVNADDIAACLRRLAKWEAAKQQAQALGYATGAEIAKQLGIAPVKIHRWGQKDRIPHYLLPGKFSANGTERMFKPEDVRAYVAHLEAKHDADGDEGEPDPGWCCYRNCPKMKAPHSNLGLCSEHDAQAKRILRTKQNA